MEEGKGKELERADPSEVEQQATVTAASTSTERGNLVLMLGSRDRVDTQVVQKHSVNVFATDPMVFQPY